MKEIPVGEYVAIVDDEDFEFLSRYHWTALVKPCTVYAVTIRGRYMHRLVLRDPTGQDVAHLDDNGLHNWRSNLLACSRKDNNAMRAAKITHCIRGHELAGYNLIIRANGSRYCRACGLERGQQYYARKRGKNA